MRSRSEIEAMIARIETDSRYPCHGHPPENVLANAPLALIQVEMKGQVAALRWILGSKMATSAAPVSRERKRP